MLDPAFLILYVDDPRRSAAFYAALLGSEPLEASPTFVMFACPSGLRLGLWSRRTVAPAPDAPPGASELAFVVADVDATFAAWQARGVTTIQAPADMDFGRAFTALDPDGHRLRVFRPARGERG